MLQRTIVSIEQDAAGELIARLMKAEVNAPNAKDPVGIQTAPALLPAMDDPGKVKEYGQRLRDALKKHPAVSNALQYIFALPAGQSRTLCFDIVSQAGEQIRWEALCDDNGDFVALNSQCRLGRIADEVSTQDVGVRVFTAPLRIAAFLSAAARDATPEWQALVSAFDTARANGLPLEARIFLGQQELLDSANAEVAAGKHPGVRVFPIPADDLGVEKALNDYSPHIVHLFCHGSAGYGTAYLELATIVDHAGGVPEGSVIVEINTLVVADGVRKSWLVVLNCCDGATSDERLTSMAFRMVANGSVPAVIGMQEPIPAGDANVFCATLYPALFELLKGALNGGAGQPSVLDLTGAIVPARRAIRNRHKTDPDGFRNWTVPVLYLSREPLQLQATMGASEAEVTLMRERVGIVAGLLRQLPPSADMALRLQFLTVLDQPPAVPPSMRPDVMGEFPLTG